MTRTIELRQPVAAGRGRTFAALTDWAAQSEWMLGTRVRASVGAGDKVGDRLEAWTGIGPLGFLDTMVITRIDDYWVEVDHIGRVVRGRGWMGVQAATDVPQSSVIVWGEELQIPLGALGRLGWVVIAPLATWGVRFSLRALARAVQETPDSHVAQVSATA